MVKNRVIYIFILAMSVVFAAAYASKLTLVLMLTLLILPVISFIVLLFTRFAVALELSGNSLFTTKQRRFTIAVKVKNRFLFPISPLKMTGTFQDDDGNLVKDKLIVASVMPFGRSEFVFDGYLKYRGAYTLGITSAELYDFLGLFRFRLKKLPVCDVVVAPRRLILGENGALCDDETDSLRTQYTFFENDTFTSVREYADGDSLRRVHWKLSAKQDKLMVKQSDLNLSSSAALLIDTSSVYEDELQGEREVDALLEAALAVARKIITEGSTAACVYHNEKKDTEIIPAQTADDFEYLYRKFSVIPVCAEEKNIIPLASDGAQVIRDSGLAFIFATVIKTETLRNALAGPLAACTGIRIFLTSEKPDEGFIALVDTDTRIRVSYIDPDNIAASLEAALFD